MTVVTHTEVSQTASVISDVTVDVNVTVTSQPSSVNPEDLADATVTVDSQIASVLSNATFDIDVTVASERKSVTAEPQDFAATNVTVHNQPSIVTAEAELPNATVSQLSNVTADPEDLTVTPEMIDVTHTSPVMATPTPAPDHLSQPATLDVTQDTDVNVTQDADVTTVPFEQVTTQLPQLSDVTSLLFSESTAPMAEDAPVTSLPLSDVTPLSEFSQIPDVWPDLESSISEPSLLAPASLIFTEEPNEFLNSTPTFVTEESLMVSLPSESLVQPTSLVLAQPSQMVFEQSENRTVMDSDLALSAETEVDASFNISSQLRELELHQEEDLPDQETFIQPNFTQRQEDSEPFTQQLISKRYILI